MIAIGSDHGGFELKKIIMQELNELKFQDYGAFSTDAVDYPDIAFQVAEDVAKGVCEKGILICRSGNGMNIAANKVRGIRAALCFNEKMAEMAKRHEDVNMITIGADYVATNDAIKMVKAWLENQFDGERHQRRIDKIKAYEDENK